jgi:Cu/Ag efflux protein CusF
MKQVSKIAIALVFAFVGVAKAADAPMAKPGVFEAAAKTVTATVVEIDYKTRAVTLQEGKDGPQTTMVVTPEATRFNEIKKGDIVQIDYLESVGVMVQSPDKTIATAEGSSSVMVRNQGKKPSGVMTETDVVTATVVTVNAKKRTATLKGPAGNTFNIDVAPDVTNLENVKKGDQVLVKYTRTVAIDVRKPDAKK